MPSKREIILNHSLRLFSKKGYEQTTINEICGRSEVAKGLIYYYFPSKESILDTIIYEGIPQNIERFGILGSYKIYPIEQVLYRTIDVCCYYMAYWKIVYVTALNSTLASKYFSTFQSQINRPYLQLAENYFKSVGSKNPETDAWLFYSLVDGLLVNMLFRNIKIDVEVVTQMIHRFFVKKFF